MIRFVLELCFTLIIILAARAILSGVMRGMVNSGRTSAPPPPATGGGYQTQNQTQSSKQAQPTGELHKDPVCGTYVAESTQFRRQVPGQTFYYCSNDCKEKHALHPKSSSSEQPFAKA